MQTLAPSEEQTGRPKSFGPKEDANFFYSYTQRGAVTKTPKSAPQKYYDFLYKEVIYHNKSCRHGCGNRTMIKGVVNNVADHIIRITPETEYEKERGLGAVNLHAVAQTLPERVRGQSSTAGSHGLIIRHLQAYTDQKVEEKRLKDLADAQAEEDRQQRELALIRQTAKPKKETVFVAPPEIIESSISYSPLMIAGVIAVVVILLLKRRRV